MPLKSRVALAWLSLWVERIWNGIWPLQAVLVAMVALGISGLLPALGPWVHSAALVVVAAWLAWTLIRSRAAWIPPSWREAERRLERDSGVDHRPLESLADQPLNPEDVGNPLWLAHKRQLAARLNRLQPKPPRSAIARLDRFAFRAAAILVLFVAAGIAGQDAWHQLNRSLQPKFAQAADLPPIFDIWIEPPEYTNEPPIFAQPALDTLTVPAGSTVVARIANAGAPALMIDETATPLEAEGEGRHALKLLLSGGSALAITDGEVPLARWGLEIVPDNPPVANLPEPPTATERGATRIDYSASDDYGVIEAYVTLVRLGDDGSETGETMTLPVLLGDGAPRALDGALFHDLTPHQWAGDPVSISLFAKDAAGQETVSPSLEMTLPERVFQHQVARQIIEQRKRLDAGEKFMSVGRALMGIAAGTPAYNGDFVVFLGLSTAHKRLRLNDVPESRDAVREAVRNLLWDIALRLEDGGLPAAERELRAAQRALQEALANDAPDDEIARLVERLRQALREFAREMAQRNANMPESAQQQNGEQQQISSEDLEKMLDRVRELAQSGAREAAQQLLSQLQQIMENLRNAQMTPEQMQQAQEMMRQMNELEELRRRQQELLDQTFRQSQQGQQGQQGQRGQQGQQNQQSQQGQQPGRQSQPGQGGAGNDGMRSLAELQEALRRDLGELMRQIGEAAGNIPEQLQDAEGSMRSAEQSLGQGNAQGALSSEANALRQLQEAAQQMANQFSQEMGNAQQGQGNEEDGDEGPGRQGRDPLGREGSSGRASTEGPKVPDEFDIQRARQIRDELYRRSSDPSRPAVEQEYLRRLLERF